MIKELNYNNFEAQLNDSENPLVIEFYSPSCVHCKKLKIALEELSSELVGNANFARVNISEQASIASQYDITSVPTLLFISSGKVKEKLIGSTHKLIIQENIKKL